MDLKATNDWLRLPEGQKYLEILQAATERSLKDIVGYAGKSTDPTVRGAYGKYVAIRTMCDDVVQARKKDEGSDG